MQQISDFNVPGGRAGIVAIVSSDRDGDGRVPRRINELVHGKREISADTARPLARALGLTDMFFINEQGHYDAGIARELLAKELATIECIA